MSPYKKYIDQETGKLLVDLIVLWTDGDISIMRKGDRSARVYRHAKKYTRYTLYSLIKARGYEPEMRLDWCPGIAYWMKPSANQIGFAWDAAHEEAADRRYDPDNGGM